MANEVSTLRDVLPTRAPSFIDFGMGCHHDQACAIYHDPEHIKSAVLDCNKGVFKPSWQAQEEGWALVKANTRFQRWLLTRFFGVRPGLIKFEGNEK